jgi:hypothetical protein
MNCARAFVLLDSLALAERGGSGRGYVMSPALEERLRLYTQCVALGDEMRLLGRR